MADDLMENLFGDLKKPVMELTTEPSSFKLIPRGNGPFREKYRPQKLEEVVPSCSIELLRNQIDNPNGSKVFLISGGTGMGKTSCARILAKANICLSKNLKEKPCLKCDACESFNSNSNYDKMELNAADKNKIEDIRDLVEDMRYAPAIYKKKVYILDEVQRLTPAAQQVLLTELENPYPYLLVFLCTTNIEEINKALVDRTCQITFNKLSAQQARIIINQIFTYEKLSASDDVIESLFNQSKGSIRALLNNIQAYSQNGYDPHIWPEDEVSNEINHIFKLITSGDWVSLAKILAKPDVRKDPEVFRMGLENYFRAVVLRTPNLNEAIKLGEALMKFSGSIQNLPAITQYNEFILKCLRACAVYKPK